MAGEIYIADKATLDKVSKDTGGLVTSMEKFPKSLPGYGVSSKFVITQSSHNATTATVVNETGKGFLYCALAMSPNNAGVHDALLVIVDGYILYNRSVSSGSNREWGGITCDSNCASGYTLSKSMVGFNGNAEGSPTNANGLVSLPLPIRYEKSLVIKTTRGSDIIQGSTISVYVQYLKD